LSACATTSPWQAPQGGGPGAYDTAPNYDGNKCATGQLSPDGTAYTFALAGKEQPRSGAFDVAIVPTPGSPPAPFAVVFNPPDDGSLALAGGSTSDTTPVTEVAPETSPAPTPVPDTSSSSSSPYVASSPAVSGSVDSSAPATLPTPTAQPANPA